MPVYKRRHAPSSTNGIIGASSLWAGGGLVLKQHKAEYFESRGKLLGRRKVAFAQQPWPMLKKPILSVRVRNAPPARPSRFCLPEYLMHHHSLVMGVAREERFRLSADCMYRMSSARTTVFDFAQNAPGTLPDAAKRCFYEICA